MAEEEEADCELDVCLDVEPIEEDVEDQVHRDRFVQNNLHAVLSFLLRTGAHVRRYFWRG